MNNVVHYVMYLFTGALLQTIRALSVSVSDVGDHTYKVCAVRNARVRGRTVTLPCKGNARNLKIKRLPHTWRYDAMVLCEVVITGRRVVCKYCKTLGLHIYLLAAGR